MARLRGLDDEAPCLRLEEFEVADVAVQLARVFADQLVAFAELECVCESLCDKEEEDEEEGGGTWAAGSGFQNMALMDSMTVDI